MWETELPWCHLLVCPHLQLKLRGVTVCVDSNNFMDDSTSVRASAMQQNTKLESSHIIIICFEFSPGRGTLKPYFYFCHWSNHSVKPCVMWMRALSSGKRPPPIRIEVFPDRIKGNIRSTGLQWPFPLRGQASHTTTERLDPRAVEVKHSGLYHSVYTTQPLAPFHRLIHFHISVDRCLCCFFLHNRTLTNVHLSW